MTYALLLLLCLSAEDAPLTIGSPSPKLASLTYVQGEPVSTLSPGTIYIIEFSGTTCVPCIECIPLLTELQTRYDDVVLISVYTEDETTIRQQLTKGQYRVGYRLAADPDGVLWENWSQPACQNGIPHAFIVGKDGKIAWIGHPSELPRPLAAVVAGNFDPGPDVMRLKIEQGIVLRQRRLEAREQQGQAEYDRINQVIIAKDFQKALVATDRALTDYRDCPKALRLLRAARFYVLVNIPDQRQAAAELAVELAIDARSEDDPALVVNTASTFLNAVEGLPVGQRDQRLVDLTIALLSEPLSQFQVFGAEIHGMAYRLRGDNVRAAESLRKAISLLETQETPNAEEIQRLRAVLQTSTND